MRTGILFLIYILFSMSTVAQSWSGDAKVLKRGGVTIDSLPLITWPNEIPPQALSVAYQRPRALATMIGGGQFVIPLAKDMHPSLRSYVSIYHTSEIDHMSYATLWRSGIGITQLKVPLEKKGYYLAIIIGPIGHFTQLFYFDGQIVRQGRREAKKFTIADH